MKKNLIIKLGLLLLTILFTAACTPNTPYHSSSIHPINKGKDHKPASIEQHKNYDIAFVEFTDRGNIFDRRQMDNALKHIDGYAKDRGVTVITYVHGWKHNSSPDDSDLKNFRRLLQLAGKKKMAGHRKLVGVYIGWRGLSFKMAGLKNLTYWSRKRVAHDVGNGGITELLLKLENSLYKNQSPTKNILINTGHSMGGAILLSAINDVLMSRILDTKEVNGCTKTKSFGHSILLVNPAVEANEIFQLKELVKQHKCYAETQDKLLHIISSDADTANKFAFKAGQWLGLSLRRKEAILKRSYNNRDFTFKEKDLDTITIANFPAFHTGRSRNREKVNDKSVCVSRDSNREECYITCSENNHQCVDKKHRKEHIPVAHNEPLSFVYTDNKFMKNHTDVFQPRIAGYIAAITEEAQHKRLLDKNKGSTSKENIINPICLKQNGKFNFTKCFDFFKSTFKSAYNEKTNN